MSGASSRAREIWDEFHADWEGLAIECEHLRRQLRHEHGLEIMPPRAVRVDPALADYTGKMRQAVVQQRIKQDFFRRAVLASYRGRYCISGVTEPRPATSCRGARTRRTG